MPVLKTLTAGRTSGSIIRIQRSNFNPKYRLLLIKPNTSKERRKRFKIQWSRKRIFQITKLRYDVWQPLKSRRPTTDTRCWKEGWRGGTESRIDAVLPDAGRTCVFNNPFLSSNHIFWFRSKTLAWQKLWSEKSLANNIKTWIPEKSACWTNYSYTSCPKYWKKALN